MRVKGQGRGRGANRGRYFQSKRDRNFSNQNSRKRKLYNTDDDSVDDGEQQQQHQIEQHEQDEQPSQSQELITDHDIPDALSVAPNNNNKVINAKRYKNITNQSKRLIIILERANLEVVKLKQNFELLNSDDHQNLIRKHNKDPALCRPDILHQCLLMLFDSPLNRAGLLQVFIHTEKNVLIEVNPQTRFPRTFKRFAFLMVQLLHKLNIRAANASEKLLRVIKNPVTDHLPVGCKKIGTSFKSTNLVHPKDLVPKDDSPLVIVIGAMAHGQVNVDYTEGDVSISQYPLSAALACTKICSAFEDAWNIF